MRGTLFLLPETKGKRRRPVGVEVFVMKDGTIHTFIMGENNEQREKIAIQHLLELKRKDNWAAIGG